MNNKTAKYTGRRKAGCWGKPHKGNRTTANRATRSIAKRVLKGGRSKLIGE